MNDIQLRLQLPLVNPGSLSGKEANGGKVCTRCRVCLNIHGFSIFDLHLFGFNISAFETSAFATADSKLRLLPPFLLVLIAGLSYDSLSLGGSNGESLSYDAGGGASDFR
jgi:hypothetical protein